MTPAGLRWLLILSAGILTARAELLWRQTKLLLEPPAGAAEMAGYFEFENRGTAPVRIVEVQSGCGCTAALAEKELVQPGEKSRIRAVFHVAGKQGKQNVGLTVVAEEPAPRRYELEVEVGIKELVAFTPKSVSWRVGEDVVAKTFELRISPEYRFGGAESSTADFEVEVIKQEAGVVHLSVKPRGLWAKRSGSIKVKVKKGEEAPIEMTAPARIL